MRLFFSLRNITVKSTENLKSNKIITNISKFYCGLSDTKYVYGNVRKIYSELPNEFSINNLGSS